MSNRKTWKKVCKIELLHPFYYNDFVLCNLVIFENYTRTPFLSTLFWSRMGPRRSDLTVCCICVRTHCLNNRTEKLNLQLKNYFVKTFNDVLYKPITFESITPSAFYLLLLLSITKVIDGVTSLNFTPETSNIQTETLNPDDDHRTPIDTL